MEPVAAFSLASAVFGTVAFSAKLISLATSIYKNGASAKAAELAMVAKEFEKTVGSLKIGGNSQDEDSYDGLKSIAQESVELSKQILERLRKLGLILDGPTSNKRDALHKATKELLNNNELTKFKYRLSDLRSRFGFQLLVSYRTFATQTLSEQKKILEALKISSQNNNKLNSSVQEIWKAVTSSSHTGELENFQSSVKLDLIRAIWHRSSPEMASRIVLGEEWRKEVEQDMFSRLSYPGMDDRMEGVAQTFENTFEWVLRYNEDSQPQLWDSLPAWLESKSQIYWIGGKPGCGKSTLMKFLSQSLQEGGSQLPRCHYFLQKWAGEREVIIVPFYFWAADKSQMQRSRTALLRTLLYHILQAKPNLIPLVFPLYWEITSLLAGDADSLPLLPMGPKALPVAYGWRKESLEPDLIHAVKALGERKVGICFFIDGLDEFDGDANSMISLVKDLVQQGDHVKVCVASRPWNEFEESFGREPHLRLEKLTSHDIRLFVTEKLDKNEDFAKFKIREATFADTLIQNIVDKSSGVFLWVALVVSSLLSCLNQGGRVRDLQKELDLLPPDLEDLYDRILKGLDSRHHEHRAQMIMLVESSTQTLPLLVFNFADEETTQSFIQLPNDTLSEEIAEVRAEAMQRRLNSRWRGLLEVTSGTVTSSYGSFTCPSVQYLHKTVKDFIQSESMSSFLEQSANQSFDPNLQLCIAYLTYHRTQVLTEENAKTVVALSLRHAKHVLADNRKDMIRCLDELLEAEKHPMYLPPKLGKILLVMAVREGAVEYVASKLHTSDGPHILGSYLLEAVKAPALDDEMIGWLLDKGANFGYSWCTILARCPSVPAVSDLDKTMQSCISAFLRHGATLVDERTAVSNMMPRGSTAHSDKFWAELEALRNELMLPGWRANKSTSFWN